MSTRRERKHKPAASRRRLSPALKRWNQFVTKYYHDHKKSGISFKQAMIAAKKLYKKTKKGGEDTAPTESDETKDHSDAE